MVVEVKDDKNLYEHERYVYKLQLDGNTNAMYTWDTIGGNRPKTIEIIAKLPQGNHTIMRHKISDSYDLKWEYNQVTGKADGLLIILVMESSINTICSLQTRKKCCSSNIIGVRWIYT